MEALISLFSIFFKILLSKSQIVRKVTKIIIFTKIEIFDEVSLQNTYFLNSKFDLSSNIQSNIDFKRDFYNIHYLVARFFIHITNLSNNFEIASIIIFALIDVVNAKLASRLNSILNENKRENTNIKTFLFFLFNPITIACCIEKSIGSIYVLLLLVIISLNCSWFYINLWLLLMSILIPEFIIFLFSFIFYKTKTTFNENYGKIILFYLILIHLLMFAIDGHPFSAYIYLFSKKDTYPNIGILWGILNETFLKFRSFSISISIIYHILLNFVVVYLCCNLHDLQKNLTIKKIEKKIGNENNYFLFKFDYHNDEEEIPKKINSICLLLLFNLQIICDWYPSELYVVLLGCMIGNLYHQFKSIYLNFGVNFLYIDSWSLCSNVFNNI